jgi:E3 ubiquitin-protein ligase RNF13/E3 ubiquitin-protein ligase RNF167
VSLPETELEGCFAKKSDHDDSPGTAEDASVSLPMPLPVSQPWFESQVECAICLSEFAKGDKARILPCHHIFHLNEVDEWLIQRKKLVRLFSVAPFTFHLQ